MRKNLQFTIYNLQFIVFVILILHFTFYILHSNVFAVSPTVTSKPSPSTTPSASPSATLTPTGTLEDEKVKELLDANRKKAIEIKLNLNQIKEKIEKKAYVGVISEVTDSTITLTNFRGKQRIRLLEDTIIIGADKKEIAAKDLAVGDKVIALGEPDTNEILEAKRVIVISPPKTVPSKRLIFFGALTAVNTKTAVLTLSQAKTPDQTLQVKIDKTTYLVNQKDPKTEIALKNFVAGQKLIIVYLEPAEGKTPLVKTIFLLP